MNSNEIKDVPDRKEIDKLQKIVDEFIFIGNKVVSSTRNYETFADPDFVGELEELIAAVRNRE